MRRLLAITLVLLCVVLTAFGPKLSVWGNTAALPLPGESFYPEGIAVTLDGTFYVGGFGTGAVVRIPPGAVKPEPFIRAGTSLRTAVGLAVDEPRRLLWACDVDFAGQTPAALKAFDLESGREKGSYAFPAGGFCNDVALDPKGNVYATDSFLGVIRRLRPGEAQLTEWSKDPQFASPPGNIGLNGIAFDGKDLLVAKSDAGRIFRVGIKEDGSARSAVALTLDEPVKFPDGIEVTSTGALIIVDNEQGSVVQATVNGTSATVTTLINHLTDPTTAALHDGDVWVVEGQLRYLFGVDPAGLRLPFQVKRAYLP